MPKKVIVIGGGVAGLTVAHELAEKGMEVTVFEQRSAWGGKCRSAYLDRPGGKRIPGEHGFRFFPGFYKHVYATMEKIPDPGRPGHSVADNLVEAHEFGMLQKGKPPYTMSLDPPGNLLEWYRMLKAAFSADLGISRDESRLFARKVLCYALSCPERQTDFYENVRWWKYIEAENHSEGFKKFCAKGLVHSLVAMPPERACTRTVGTLLVQMFAQMSTHQGKADRVLNGPTTDVWITPWTTFLENQLRVKLLPDARVERINFDHAARRVTSVTVGAQEHVADHYVSTLPAEKLKVFLSEDEKVLAGVKGVDELDVAWMTGILFYMKKEVPLVHGHAMYADSPWALTSLSQGQFWDPGRFPLAEYGNGDIKDIISAIICDWEDKEGWVEVDKIAKECDEDELFREAFAQLRVHRTHSGSPLDANDIADRSLDLSIRRVGGKWENEDELLINTAGSFQHRLPAKTLVSNLYIASDCVRTTTDLATMESANEAARMAAQAILSDAGIAGKVYHEPLVEPFPFPAFQRVDRRLGLPIAGADKEYPLWGRLPVLLEKGVDVTPADVDTMFKEGA